MTSATRWIGAGLGLAMAGYGAMVGAAYLGFGRRKPPAPDADRWLDRFLPTYDIIERHQVRVSAPASVTLAAALDTDLEQSPIIRGIIRARELVLGARPDRRRARGGLLEQMTSIGWGVLAEDPGREVVLGAVTQPWLPEVVFRPLPPDAFAAFDEPGFVKIAWTVRVDPVSDSTSEFRTETRAVATDPTARRTFRWYWARFSPGIVIIRQVVLRMVKAEAERRTLRPAPAAGEALR